MKKNILVIGGLFVILILGILIFSNQNQFLDDDSGKLKIAATIFPVADIASNIGGDNVEVKTILKPGASPHTFEVTPSDIKSLQDAKVIFAIGWPLDNWTDDILAVDENVKLVKVDNGIEMHLFMENHHHDEDADHEDHDEYGHEEDHEAEDHEEGAMKDPHYWLSVKNAKIIAGNIADVLIEQDPANKMEYQNNLQNYLNELDELEVDLKNELQGLEKRELIVFHESWNYFAKEYGLKIAGVVQLSPGKEPTPAQLAELHDAAGEHGITAIFSEPQLSPDTIRPFVEDLNLDLFVLDPLGGVDGRDSYIQLLKYNAQTIKQALQQ
ncbi:MAG: metal ABC transporter substrate-binding protein [Patescibacteria group bacterium]